MDIYRCFTGWSIDQGADICVPYERMGRGLASNEDVLGCVGPEHDVNTMK